MTVAELIETLKTLPKDLDVVIRNDHDLQNYDLDSAREEMLDTADFLRTPDENVKCVVLRCGFHI